MVNYSLLLISLHAYLSFDCLLKYPEMELSSVLGLVSDNQFEEQFFPLQETDFISADGRSTTTRKSRRSIDMQTRLYRTLQASQC